MNQFNLFEENFNKLEHSLFDSGNLVFVKNYYDINSSKIIYQKLINDIKWEQENIKMYGKTFPVPRLSAWYGENNTEYSYSGISHIANKWNDVLLEIKNKFEKEFNIQTNSVLLNRYRDGNDSVSWHADDEKELGLNPIIVSLSFGEKRKFQLKNIETKERLDIELESGDLLIMKGEIQDNWQHQVPKSKKKLGERINLTFRNIII